MNRREFLGVCAVSSLAANTTPLFASQNNQTKRVFNVKFEFDLSHITKTNAALWIPLPSNTDFQLISPISVFGQDDKHIITDDNAYKAKTLFKKWAKDESYKKISLSFAVSTTDVKTDFSFKKISRSAKIDAKRYIAPTAHIRTDGIVAETSAKIAVGHKTQLSKARAIYDWVVENMYRDPDVKGCGVGNAKEALEQKRFGGKCLDISAVFVALLRAQNIPARELMGIRLGKSSISEAFGSSEDISKAQHCRAEFFIDDIGWVRADPGDITKLRLVEKLGKQSAREAGIADMYFGGFEMNWMALNHARDFNLHPLPVQYPLDQFNYPYGEALDDVLDFYDPKTFKYSFTSVQQ